MTDEDKKRIVSEPPPPTDEIDGEWDDDETLVRAAPSLSDPPKVSVRPGATSASSPPSSTSASSSLPPLAAATASIPPIGVKPTASAATTPIPDAPSADTVSGQDEDEDEGDGEHDEASEDESDEPDEDEDDEDEDDGDDERAATAPPGSQDWIPEWAPFAVLGVLVSASILFGLGLVGGPQGEGDDGAAAEQAQPATGAPSAVKPARPIGHP